MLGTLLKSLGLGGTDDGPVGTETVRAIADAVEHLPADRARFVAAFAYLLSRVAFADHEVTPGELDTMERQVAAVTEGLSESHAAEAVRLAMHATGRHGATEDYLVAREFAALATEEEKLRLLRCLFALSANHGISTSEDNEISRIANGLRMEQRQVAQVRAEFRAELNVLRARQRAAGVVPPAGEAAREATRAPAEEGAHRGRGAARLPDIDTGSAPAGDTRTDARASKDSDTAKDADTGRPSDGRRQR